MIELTRRVVITSLFKGSDSYSLELVHEKHHCPPPLSQHFAGHEKELNKLKSISRKHGIAAIVQYGRTGKTELMVSLAQSVGLEEELAGNVLWLTVHDGLESVVESLGRFVDKLRGGKMSEEDRKNRILVVAQLKESLSRRKGRCFQYLEKADKEEISAVVGAVCAIATSSKEKGWVVVTSRLGLPRLWKEMKEEQKVNLQPQPLSA